MVTPPTDTSTLPLHDALPILGAFSAARPAYMTMTSSAMSATTPRSEEHTSELQSRRDLVCRLLLEKKMRTLITARLGWGRSRRGTAARAYRTLRRPPRASRAPRRAALQRKRYPFVFFFLKAPPPPESPLLPPPRPLPA